MALPASGWASGLLTNRQIPPYHRSDVAKFAIVTLKTERQMQIDSSTHSEGRGPAARRWSLLFTRLPQIPRGCGDAKMGVRDFAFEMFEQRF